MAKRPNTSQAFEITNEDVKKALTGTIAWAFGTIALLLGGSWFNVNSQFAGIKSDIETIRKRVDANAEDLAFIRAKVGVQKAEAPSQRSYDEDTGVQILTQQVLGFGPELRLVGWQVSADGKRLGTIVQCCDMDGSGMHVRIADATEVRTYVIQKDMVLGSNFLTRTINLKSIPPEAPK